MTNRSDQTTIPVRNILTMEDAQALMAENNRLHAVVRDYRSDAEWMATYIMGRLPDRNTMTPAEIADYEQKLREIVERVADGIGKP